MADDKSHILKKIGLNQDLDELYNKTIVDVELDENSSNPVENQAIARKILDINNEIETLYTLIEPLVSELELKIENLDSINETEVNDFYLS